MPYPLNNVATLDQYSAAATFTPPRPTQKINITVANAGVYMKMERCDDIRVNAGIEQPEEFLVPGVYGLTRQWGIGRVQFRSGAIGQPARVSVAAALA